MLNRLALRIATVRALRGRTLAGSRVLDSEIAPIDDIAAEHPTPVIVVYTDDGHFRGAGRDLFGTSGDTRVDVGFQHLVIDIAMTQRMTLTDEATGQQIEDAVPPVTDAALEFNLDIIERQVVVALMDTAPAAKWAEMWRQLVLDIGDRESRRGASMRDGVRFAGRQIRLSCKIPKDPPAGVAIGPLWANFLSLAAEEADLAPILPLLNQAIAGAELTPDEALQSAYGLTRAEADALKTALPPASPMLSPPDSGIDDEGAP